MTDHRSRCAVRRPKRTYNAAIHHRDEPDQCARLAQRSGVGADQRAVLGILHDHAHVLHQVIGAIPHVDRERDLARCGPRLAQVRRDDRRPAAPANLDGGHRGSTLTVRR